MADHQWTTDLLNSARAVGAALAPSAAGATVATLMKGDMSWGARAVQIFVGIVVSWYARLAIDELFTPGPFMSQSIAFTIGLLASDALPKLRDRAIVRLTAVPDAVADWIARRFGGSK